MPQKTLVLLGWRFLPTVAILVYKKQETGFSIRKIIIDAKLGPINREWGPNKD
jgi:hypothetical protein